VLSEKNEDLYTVTKRDDAGSRLLARRHGVWRGGIRLSVERSGRYLGLQMADRTSIRVERIHSLQEV